MFDSCVATSSSVHQLDITSSWCRLCLYVVKEDSFKSGLYNHDQCKDAQDSMVKMLPSGEAFSSSERRRHQTVSSQISTPP